MQTSEVTLVIPAYNEEESLRQFLPELLEFCGQNHMQLVVVDDCSTDGTGEMLDKAAASHDFLRVCHHKVNRGYGGALISGLQLSQTRFSVTLDADGQHRLEDVPRLLEKQQEVDADLVVGARADDSGGGSGLYRALGKKLIRFTAGRLVDDLPISDLNSGMKLYDTKLAQRYLRLCPDGMAFSEVLPLIFIQQKHLVTETPITVAPRRSGKSTINTMTALDTLFQIINIVMVFNPMRIFLPVGGILILLGVLWAIPFLVRGSGLSSVSMMSMTAGLLLIMMGLLAEQLAQIRKKDL
ncbi:MAG: glycosyltransferase family 2 protein [Flexilinea sp.]|nr:glycosyltransferase family 2 protein [Flexilinea sp.]